MWDLKSLAGPKTLMILPMGHFPSESQLVTFTTNILFKKAGLKSFLGISMSKYIFFSELTKKAVLEE